MNRRAFLKHLHREGARLLREGGKHSIWWNPVNGRKITIPRHSEISNGVVRSVCHFLQISRPLGW